MSEDGIVLSRSDTAAKVRTGGSLDASLDSVGLLG